MNRLAWATDIHLNFLEPSARNQFYTSILELEPDALLISGDISEAPTLLEILSEMQAAIPSPLFFVLGNHDFYHGSIHGVRSSIAQQLASNSGLVHLNSAGTVELNSDTALVGHDGWADGRVGDFDNSTVRLNDHLLIEELSSHLLIKKYRVFNRSALHKEVKRLGDEAADYFATLLPETLSKYKDVIVLTHVPPFKESCPHWKSTNSQEWLPHFVSKAVGDVLREIMRQRPSNRMLVLAGHTHTRADIQILPNLRVRVGAAEYRHPKVQQMIDLGAADTEFGA